MGGDRGEAVLTEVNLDEIKQTRERPRMKIGNIVMANVDLLEIHEAGPGEHVQGEALEAVVAHVEDLGPDVDVVRDRGSPRASALHSHLA